MKVAIEPQPVEALLHLLSWCYNHEDICPNTIFAELNFEKVIFKIPIIITCVMGWLELL